VINLLYIIKISLFKTNRMRLRTEITLWRHNRVLGTRFCHKMSLQQNSLACPIDLHDSAFLWLGTRSSDSGGLWSCHDMWIHFSKRKHSQDPSTFRILFALRPSPPHRASVAGAYPGDRGCILKPADRVRYVCTVAVCAVWSVNSDRCMYTNKALVN